jgi:hypothetical protein
MSVCSDEVEYYSNSMFEYKSKNSAENVMGESVRIINQLQTVISCKI